MNKIYFVYEVDGHRSHDSRAVKGVFLNKRLAYKEYNRIKKGWIGSDWILCLGVLEASLIAVADTDVLRDIDELESTEDEE